MSLGSLPYKEMMNLLKQIGGTNERGNPEFNHYLDVYARGDDLIGLKCEPPRYYGVIQPYDYSQDGEYQDAVGAAVKFRHLGNWNKQFLTRLAERYLKLIPGDMTIMFPFRGPLQAPEPAEQHYLLKSDGNNYWSTYISPSYIVWEWDSSYISFLGS